MIPAIAGLGVVAGALGVAAYDRVAAPGGLEQARIGRVVHDYVLAHPDILPEAMDRLRAQDTAKAIAASGDTLETPVGDAWAGNPKGDVTVVEYFDYNCGYCRASLPTIAQLIAQDPKVRVVFRDLPVLAPSSGIAAQMSVAAALDGKFARFHDALYAAGPVSDATLAGAARVAGLDPAALRQAAQAPAVVDAVRDNLSTAHALGVAGTPAFVIGDHLMTGAQPLADLQAAVDAARTAAKGDAHG